MIEVCDNIVVYLHTEYMRGGGGNGCLDVGHDNHNHTKAAITIMERNAPLLHHNPLNHLHGPPF